MIRKASASDIAFQKMMEQGQLEHYQSETKFIREHGRVDLRKFRH